MVRLSQARRSAAVPPTFSTGVDTSGNRATGVNVETDAGPFGLESGTVDAPALPRANLSRDLGLRKSASGAAARALRDPMLRHDLSLGRPPLLNDPEYFVHRATRPSCSCSSHSVRAFVKGPNCGGSLMFYGVDDAEPTQARSIERRRRVRAWAIHRAPGA